MKFVPVEFPYKVVHAQTSRHRKSVMGSQGPYKHGSRWQAQEQIQCVAVFWL